MKGKLIKGVRRQFKQNESNQIYKKLLDFLILKCKLSKSCFYQGIKIA